MVLLGNVPCNGCRIYMSYTWIEVDTGSPSVDLKSRLVAAANGWQKDSLRPLLVICKERSSLGVVPHK